MAKGKKKKRAPTETQISPTRYWSTTNIRDCRNIIGMKTQNKIKNSRTTIGGEKPTLSQLIRNIKDKTDF